MVDELAVCRWYWAPYFKDDAPTSVSILQEVAQIIDFFRSHDEKRKDELVQGGAVFVEKVNWRRQREVIIDYEEFESRVKYARFKNFRYEFDHIVAVIGMALCVLREAHLGVFPIKNQVKPTSRDDPPITPIFMNVLPMNSMREIQASSHNRLLSIRGTVTRVSASRPMVKYMDFQCIKCGESQPQNFQFGKYEEPTSCAADGCRGTRFTALFQSAVCIDRQTLRIQELETDIMEAGRMPRTIECEVSGKLIDACVPGDVVSAVGVLRALEVEVAAGRGLSDRSVFSTFLQCHSIVNNRSEDSDLFFAPDTISAQSDSQRAGGATMRNRSEMQLKLQNFPIPTEGPLSGLRHCSERTKQLVLDIVMPEQFRDSSSPGAPGIPSIDYPSPSIKDPYAGTPFGRVLASFAPKIVGNETVKLGLLLSLFGASRNSGGQEEGSSMSGSSNHTDLNSSVESHSLDVSFDRAVHNHMSALEILTNGVVDPDLESDEEIAENKEKDCISQLAEELGIDIQYNSDEDERDADGLIRIQPRAPITDRNNTESESTAELSALTDAGLTAGGSLKFRSDIHVLVVGDPGMGKSELLRFAAKVAPVGVFVSGQSATSAGLTASVVSDPSSSGSSTLEAGALVLSDNGTVCIDEFDKMKGEHPALLEAMEQQVVSVAKHGVVTSLRARAAVLAAANPAGGHYDLGKPVSENLKISKALLSRFDLTFVLRDSSNFSKDSRLARHLLDNWNNNSGANAGNNSQNDSKRNKRSQDSSDGIFQSSKKSKRQGNDDESIALRNDQGSGEYDVIPSVSDSSDSNAIGGDFDAERNQRNTIRRIQTEFSQLPPSLVESALSQIVPGSLSGPRSSQVVDLQSQSQYLSQTPSQGFSQSSRGGFRTVSSALPHGDLLNGIPSSQSLQLRLKASIASVKPHDILNQKGLKKYIQYARKYCHPLLLPSSAIELAQYYRVLRGSSSLTTDGLPVTTRQLESLVRLSCARARLDLAPFVTSAHIADIICLMKSTLSDIGLGSSILDDSSGPGLGGNVANNTIKKPSIAVSKAMKAYFLALQREAVQTCNPYFQKSELLTVANKLGLPAQCGLGSDEFVERAINGYDSLSKFSKGYKIQQ